MKNIEEDNEIEEMDVAIQMLAVFIDELGPKNPALS